MKISIIKGGKVLKNDDKRHNFLQISLKFKKKRPKGQYISLEEGEGEGVREL